MSKLFSSNAYNVLGIDTTVGQRDANKRAKEIVNLLRIDEELGYDTDLKISKPKRDEASVKSALQRLTSPVKRIKEYFFWFDIENDNDEKALDHLTKEEYSQAISIWDEQANKETAKAFTAKKNLAILTSILLIDGGQKKYLTQSIGLWKDLIDSSKFWAHFSKVYALNDEVGTSDSAIEEFQGQVINDLSDLYTDISQRHKDNNYYSHFSKTFGVTGKKMQDEVLSPIYEKVNNTATKLAGLNISEDNIITPQEIMTLRRLVKQLQDDLQKLKDLGLYDDSQSRTMRDKAAEAIRTVALDLYNNLGESTKTVALLNVAITITGTPGLKDKLNKDIQDAKKFMSDEKVVKPINELLGEEKYAEALDLILAEQDKHKKNKNLTEYFSMRLQWCVTAIATEHFIESKELYEKERYVDAAPRFESVRDFVNQYIDEFNFNNDALQNILSSLENMMANATSESMKSVDEYRNKVVDQAEDVFKDQFEKTIFIILIDSIIYGRLSQLIPQVKRQNVSNRVKGWIWTIVIFIIIAIIGGAFSSGSSNDDGSSGSSGSSSCSSELSSIETQINSIESRMSSYEASGDNDSYNDLVPKQNALVSSYNSKLAECQ